MRMSAIGNRPPHRSAAGFTLIEMLVVLVMIGLMTAAVVVSFSPSRDLARSEAQRFMARMQIAAQDSILSGRPVGASVDEDGYRFYHYRLGQWRQDDTAGFAPAVWDKAIRAQVTFDSSLQPREVGADMVRPLVVFDPTGLVTPFAVNITTADSGYVVRATAGGEMKVAAYDPAS